MICGKCCEFGFQSALRGLQRGLAEKWGREPVGMPLRPICQRAGKGSGQITKGLLSHLCGRCADRAPAAEGRTAQAKPSLLRPSANLKKDDQKVVFEDLNLLIQGVISSLFPLSLPHTGIGQRHGQREKRQGEETHPDRTSPLRGALPCYRRERFPVLSLLPRLPDPMTYGAAAGLDAGAA